MMLLNFTMIAPTFKTIISAVNIKKIISKKSKA